MMSGGENFPLCVESVTYKAARTDMMSGPPAFSMTYDLSAAGASEIRPVAEIVSFDLLRSRKKYFQLL
jgi:hypothetical protein